MITKHKCRHDFQRRILPLPVERYRKHSGIARIISAIAIFKKVRIYHSRAKSLSDTLAVRDHRQKALAGA